MPPMCSRVIWGAGTESLLADGCVLCLPQALELSNFSLAQHLRQATDARSISSSGRDVF